MDIKRVIKKLAEFSKQNLGNDAKVVEVSGGSGGWNGLVEVYEDDPFIKSLGLGAPVKTRQLYEIQLDDNLQVVGFGLHQALS
jgi:hypothetical protein